MLVASAPPCKTKEPERDELDPLQTLQPLQLQSVEDQAKSLETIELTEAASDSGLQDLASVERLMITKKVAMKQLLSLQSQRSRYIVRAAGSALAYSVLEENTWWLGFLCYGLRPCQLKVLNKAGEEIIRILRPFAFTTRVTPCQLQRMEVYSPPDKLIGTIEQIWTPMKPCYSIKGPDGEELFSVQGPSNTLGIYRDLHFDIVRPAGDRVGSTWKRWRGLAHALFRSPTLDKFGLAFQRDLSVEEKTLLLASSLLIDYITSAAHVSASHGTDKGWRQLTDSPANKVNTCELGSGKKVVLFAGPGALTPGCSNTHLPGYVQNADKIKADGVDEIVCISVNDPYVMAAWGAQHNTKGKVRMLADPNGTFIKALDLGTNLPPLGGFRSKRFSVVLNDNKVEQLNVEPDGTGLSCFLADKLKVEK